MDITREIAVKVLKVVDAGLTSGLGKPTPGQMCVEAAVAYAMGEGHSDRPTCVARAVRALKIRLNDSLRWKTNASRAQGMRRLAIAQLGTAGVLDEKAFAARVAELAIRTCVPFALRVSVEIQKDTKRKDSLEAAAIRCEKEGTVEAEAAYAAYAAYAAANAANAATYAAYAAAYAADAANAADAADAEKPLRDFAEGVVQILIEMGAPGTKWLDLTE